MALKLHGQLAELVAAQAVLGRTCQNGTFNSCSTMWCMQPSMLQPVVQFLVQPSTG